MPAIHTQIATTTRRSRALKTGADFRVTVRPGDAPGISTVEAWLVVPGVGDSSRCLVVAEGFDDGWHFGAGPIRCSFSPDRPGHWQREAGHWRWAISAWRGPDDGTQAAVAWMEERFAGIRVQVRLQPVAADRPSVAAARNNTGRALAATGA